MMNARKLLTSIPFYSIPRIVQSSLRRAQDCIATSNPPFPAKNPNILSTDLIKSYFEEGLVEEARILFDEMHERDVVAWTAMIAGYMSCNLYNHAWDVFCGMLKNKVEPNEFSISSVLKACRGMDSLLCGELVHGLVIKLGAEGHIYVDNALVNLYASCCTSMDKACMVFRQIHRKNSASWTSLIAGFTHKGDGYSGISVFHEMLLEGVKLDPYTVSIAVRACASIGSCISGQQVHGAVIKFGFQFNLPVMNSILDMYCRCSSLPEASQHFHEMGDKDTITWNALISGYERAGSFECLHLFSQMESQGFHPNCFTFTSVTAACGHLAILTCGQQVHGGIIRRGLAESRAISNALIDMYAKCGNIIESRKIFDAMSVHDLLSWTSMLTGYGAHGRGKEAVELFDEMLGSGIKPDRIVLMAVLSACSHAGLLDEGLSYFQRMEGEFNVSPSLEVYGCAIDLLGRAGRVEEAYQLIQSMPFRPDESIWGALLGACRAYRLQNLGKLVARKVLDLRPNLVGTYVMLSNIYAAEGIWGEFAEVRKLMRGVGSKKEPGKSWIEVRNQVLTFVAGDKMIPQIECIHEILGLLSWNMREDGYRECSFDKFDQRKRS